MRPASIPTLLTLSAMTLFGCAHSATSHIEATMSAEEATPSSHHSQYAEGYDLTTGLSNGEIEDLRKGAGMGLARPAELNSYPGPLHVLALANELELTEEQLAQTNEIFSIMNHDAVELGEQVITLEQTLYRRFNHAHIDEVVLADLTSEIAELRGELRRTHLRAHLSMREILDPNQIERYDSLRGYESHTVGHHSMQH